MFFNITLGSGMNSTYYMSWEAPAKGITIINYNSFYVIGCEFDVNLFDHERNPVGSCMSRCHGEVLPTTGPCNGIGCCFISLREAISGFHAIFSRAGSTAAQSDPLHTGIMAFMSGASDYYYTNNATTLFRGWTNTSLVDGADLEVAITDQPSCESAQMNNSSYACATNSICRNASSYRGYHCYCSGYSHQDGNPYLLEGCTQGTASLLFSTK
jgi:hypothetical protein